MAKSPALSTYARIVGEVAIGWNELERVLDALIYHYLTVSAPVAGFILGEMGNATKAEFAKFLIGLYESDAALSEHALYSVSLINRIRENRNILEHGHPHSYSGLYHGRLWKVSKRGGYVEFDAPISQLQELLGIIQNLSPYVRWLIFCLQLKANNVPDAIKNGPTTAEAAIRTLSSLERPQLPDKIAPLPPPEGLEGE